MSNIVVPVVELLQKLDNYISSDLNGCDLRLGTNDVTPNRDSVLGDFTEASFAGYAAQTLGAWSSAFDTGADVATTHPTVTFSNTDLTDEAVYTAYATLGSPADTLLFATRLDGAPVTIPAGTGSLDVTPTYTEDNT